MKFKIGDKVKFINDSIEGEVTRITNRGRYAVVCQNGFEHETIGKNLILSIDFSDDVRVSFMDIAEKNMSHKTSKKNKQVAKKNRGGVYREIDLHIDELLESRRGMSGTELFNYQISIFKRELDRAIINNERKIIFIHGVGEGVLRDEIWSIVRLEYPEVNCYEASYKAYGFGATEIVIHN